ncbi:MAG: GspH/FimT family pseudopilin [Granulosicoccus sp.]|nr:GspH/FimT family pseudopilin [Granulosicoccus sp.]
MTIIKHENIHWMAIAKRDSGFTLLELLVVMAIVGIVGTIALPSFRTQIQNENASSGTRYFANSIGIARSSAIKLGTPVVMCASASGTTCSGDWEDGWLVFQDDDRDDQFDSDESVLRRHVGENPNLSISVDSVAGNELDRMSFNFRGLPGVSFDVSVSSGSAEYGLSINAFGKTRLIKESADAN